MAAAADAGETVVPISGKKHIKVKLKSKGGGQIAYPSIACSQGFGAFVRGPDY